MPNGQDPPSPSPPGPSFNLSTRQVSPPSLDLAFSRGGNASRYTLSGWSNPEPRHTWSTSFGCDLLLPMPQGTNDLQLELELRPATGPYLAGQRLIISVNGEEVDRDFLRGPATIAHYIIPRARLTGTGNRPFFHLRLDTPDARTPSGAGGASADPRVLGFAVTRLSIRELEADDAFTPASLPPLPEQDIELIGDATKHRTGIDLPTLARCFQSLGHNCEFGLVQRHFGAEPLGLLRFASISPANLLTGLKHRFEGFAAPENLTIECVNDKGDLMVRDRIYNSLNHAWATRGQVDETRLLHDRLKHFGSILTMFHETLALGHRIFVFQHAYITSPAIVRPIAATLREHGPNILLWVSAGSDLPPGSVRVIGPGLLHGAITEFAPWHEAPKSDRLCWASILANAYCLARASGWDPKL
jgi:hypothetical protein